MTRALYLDRWRVDLTTRDGVVPAIAGAGLARAIVAAIEAAGAPSPASIGLILSDDVELAALNAAHLGVTGATDVLSFPLLPPESFPPHPGGTHRSAGAPDFPLPPGAPDFPLPPGRPAGAPDFPLPPGRRLHLGDIVISVERAIEQAEAGRGGQTGDVRWSAADELRLLAIHGALHVCGWDHAEPDEEAAMRALEKDLLAAG